MATDFDEKQKQLSDWYRSRTEREQLLIKIWIAVVPVLLLIAVGWFLKQHLDDIEQQTDQYRQTLELVSKAGPNYVKSKSKSTGKNTYLQRFTQKTLENNQVQLETFLEKHAQATDVSIDNYRPDERPVDSAQSGEKTIIKEQWVTAHIRRANINNFLKFLERLDNTDKPVVITRITFRNDRGDPERIRRAQVRISTFKQEEKKQG